MREQLWTPPKTKTEMTDPEPEIYPDPQYPKSIIVSTTKTRSRAGSKNRVTFVEAKQTKHDVDLIVNYETQIAQLRRELEQGSDMRMSMQTALSQSRKDKPAAQTMPQVVHDLREHVSELKNELTKAVSILRQSQQQIAKQDQDWASRMEQLRENTLVEKGAFEELLEVERSARVKAEERTVELETQLIEMRNELGKHAQEHLKDTTALVNENFNATVAMGAIFAMCAW